ncbi:mannosyltransferase [Scheffersomyces xylosifermentans]|uniref:mannosyltransferase n=1 Tax=Scheffersomyces xylosifermentans TaxID=1304137 RepID=UPI00315DCEEB
MRFTVRRGTVFILALVGCLVLYRAIQNDVGGLFSLYNDIFVHERFDEVGFRKADLLVREELHYSKYLFSGYANFTKIFKNDIEAIKKKPLQERCTTFFKQFNENNRDYRFEKFDKPGYQYDKDVDKKESFFERNQHFITKDRESKEITLADNITLNKVFSKQIQKTKIIDQNMADTITLMRLYGKCFLGDVEPVDKELQNLFTLKLFPYLHNSLPLFEMPNKTEPLPPTSWPLFNDDIRKYEFRDEKFDQNSDNFIDFIKKNSHGKGLVISATTRHSRDIIKLIRVLRALNNKLPIQIVHKGDLNKRSKEFIEIAARADIDFLLDPVQSQEHRDFLPDLNMLDSYRDFGSEFPVQKVLFVNIGQCINRSYKYSFPGYSNKLLALLYTTFKEVILLDADTVPLVPMEEFFNSPEYKKSSAYFFRDRSLRDWNDFIETNFFTKLFPINKNSMDTLFDIPLVTEKTLSNKYLLGWRHSMEAGVVAINKVDHFLGVLMTFPLSLWKEPVQSSVWGDKEMYWLGLSMAGDENYEFNKFAAASVGEVTHTKEHKFYPNSESNEVCSSHPGHVDANGRLLWINSGFGYCKKNGYFRDRIKFPFSRFNQDELTEKFKNPLKVRAALVPPDLPDLRPIGSPVDDTASKEFIKSWKLRKRDIDEINENLPEGTDRTEFITDWDPQKGWVKNSICFGYYYCAYDKVESYTPAADGSPSFSHGHLFEYDDKTTQKLDYLSKVWHTGHARLMPEGWVFAVPDDGKPKKPN